MKIFISWSGPLSRAVAATLREWLPSVVQAVEPWMSEEDIPTGGLWFDGIHKSIDESDYGILCLTRDNKNAPWMLWEAGALFRGFDDTRRVVPLLIDLVSEDLGPPLSNFQAFSASDRGKMAKMLAEINSGLTSKLPVKILEKQLTLYWDEWTDALAKAIKDHPHVPASESNCEYTFRDAADKFLEIRARTHTKSIDRLKDALRYPRLYIDDLPLDRVDNAAMREFVEDRQAGTIKVPEGDKVPIPSKPRTINKDIQTVGLVLKTAARDWEWIPFAPKLKGVQANFKSRPYILPWDQQSRLFALLADYVRKPALFAVNTGARRGLIQSLEWAWYREIPEINARVFTIPPGVGGSKYERTILLNSVAKSIVELQENQREIQKLVFPGARGGKINLDKPWRKAWGKAGLPTDEGYIRGFDTLYRTFERRLAQVEVSLEDRDLLLWTNSALRRHQDIPIDYDRLLQQLEKIAVPTVRE